MTFTAKTALADVCASVQYGYTASASENPCGPHFLRITDIVPDAIDWDSVPYCPINDKDKERFSLAVGDIVVARTGATVGYAKLIREPVDAVFASYLVRFRVDERMAVPAYVGRLVESHVYKAFVKSRIGGAAQPNASAPVLGSFTFSLPSAREQERIAAILSAYDDLIANNRRRIQLLEDAARLLYREWFVRLRFPGHEHAKIRDGVPEGWESRQVKTLLAKVKRPGKIQKGDYLLEGNFPCVDQSREFIGGYTDDEGAVIRELPMIIFGDHTRIIKYIDFPFACGADGTQLIASNNPKLSQEYLYFALDAIDLSNYFYARHFKYLKDQYILCPTDIILEGFTQMAALALGQIKILRQQNYTLSKARDLLLPKLMSGEVAV